MIAADPSVCFGQPVFSGTRVLVDGIVGQLRNGVPRQELEADFPQIGAAAFDWAAGIVDNDTNREATP